MPDSWKFDKNNYKELSLLNEELKKEVAFLKNEVLEKDKEIKKLTSIDAVTKVYNRKRIFKYLEKEFARAQRYKLNFSIILINIDDFDKINDIFGFDTGDMVLGELALELRRLIRFIDILGRYGSDEFLIIFPETELEYAKVISQRILETIEKMTLSDEIKVTISIGLTSFNQESSFNDLLINTMDKLSLAKKNGKNRMEF